MKSYFLTEAVVKNFSLANMGSAPYRPLTVGMATGFNPGKKTFVLIQRLQFFKINCRPY